MNDFRFSCIVCCFSFSEKAPLLGWTVRPQCQTPFGAVFSAARSLLKWKDAAQNFLLLKLQQVFKRILNLT